MVYAIAIEPPLRQLRQSLTGLTLTALNHKICLSAYADDITVLINDPKDTDTLKGKLELSEKASSTKVNWEKCDGLLLGKWSGKKSANFTSWVAVEQRGN